MRHADADPDSVVKVGLGCAAHLVALCTITVLVDRLTSTHLPSELRFFVAVPAGLLLTLGLSNLWTLARGYGQGATSRAAILERARTGEPPKQDGPIVITGVVRADAGTLRGPLSGIECVAYQYRLYTNQWLPGRRLRQLPMYWGYAARPFRIDSAGHAFHVVAVPQLADKATQHDSNESLERVQAYVAATRFEPKAALAGIASAAATTFGELLAEPAGDVRRDWQAAHIPFGIDALLREETVVPVGATVSVSGRWSAARGAIVPGEMAEGQLGLTLVTGTAEELGRGGRSQLPWSVPSVAFTAALCLLAGAALVWLSSSGQMAEWWRTLR
jgi:hypothetical protein